MSTVDTGSPGASADHECERRRAAREVRVKAQLGNLIGGIALTLAGETQSTRAWKRGAVGEQKLAEALAGVDGLVVLHDRRVRGTSGNIDHIVIAPARVFVVDAMTCPGFDGGCILWEDVAHGSIEAANAQAWIGTPTSS